MIIIIYWYTGSTRIKCLLSQRKGRNIEGNCRVGKRTETYETIRMRKYAPTSGYYAFWKSTWEK